MRRIGDPTLFRAAGALLDWTAVLRRRMAQGQEWPDLDRQLRRLKGREDLRLVWSCHRALGVPHRAFTVWQRTVSSPTKEVEVNAVRVTGGDLLTWDGIEAACVQVTCDVADPGRPVGLFLLRGGGPRPGATLAADVQPPGGRATLVLRARCGGATSAVLVNGHATSVVILPLAEVVEAENWEELETVGLPIDGTLRDYSTDPQGLVGDLTDPVDAALRRLDRAGPPLGWWPVTETGLLAPPWRPPDPGGLVTEVQTFLLPEVERLYSAGLPEREQHRVIEDRAVDPPSQDGRRAAQDARAQTPPLGTLLLAAGTDPAVCLVLGFGTGYAAEHLMNHPAEVELLVTAPYRHSHLGDDVELAAYLPPPGRHAALAPVVDLSAARAALIPPTVRDAPHRESVELSWRPPQPLATLTDPVALALAAFAPGDSEATSRLAERPGGGPQARALAVPVPDPARAPVPGRERPRLVDADLPLPLEGTVTRGYAVAQVDLFGIWSRWEDVTVTTASPVLLPPRIGRLELTARHVAGASCPSRLVVNVATDWTERSPRTVEVVALFFPMPTGATPPPAGIGPESAVPAGCHRRDRTIAFTGDVPGPAGLVVPLREDGSVATTAGPVEQGATGRSYRLTEPGPDLDFGPVSRWGVRVWVRQTSPGFTVPTGWSPAPDHPATAVVGSPVPHVPPPPPQPPGVPLASTPDAQGLPHARVAWSGLTSPQVDRVVVWETSETALRRHLAPGSPGDRIELPGWRLQQLWDLYEAAPADRRQGAFRRCAEVAAGPGATDVTLPRGSEDIHLFLVTAVSTTGLESPWPAAGGGTPARGHLQAVMAPRLRRPAQPVVRPEVQTDGSVVVRMEAASSLRVAAFEVFATRSAAAAREHLTMGPPVATVAASATPRTDPVTGDTVHEAVWSGGLPPSWDPWHVRAVAVPVPTVPEEGVRGLVSVASDVVTVAVRPTGPPDLDPLAAEVVGTDHRGVLLRTSTAAPARVVSSGSHRLVVTVGGAESAAQALEDLAEVPDDGTPPAAGTVVQRLPRTGGRTGLLVWTRRAEPTDPLAVALRLTDPLGRTVERAITVPGWVPPDPHLTLTVVDGFRVVGRGWVLELLTSARADEVPPYELDVLVTRSRRPLPLPRRPLPRLPLPRLPLPGRPVFGPAGPLLGSLRATFVLPEIPLRRRAVPPRGAGITAARSDETDGTRVALWLPTTTVHTVQLVVRHPHHGRVQETWRP